MTYPIHPFTLHRPETVQEALALAGQYPGAPYLAGGTDLMVNLRKRLAEPEHVISLARVSEMEGIAADNGTLTIGALTTMNQLAADPVVTGRAAALAQAAAVVAGPTIRGMATLGGNLLLDTRCRYYNQSHFWRQANDFCLKKDGTICHVAPGGTFCWAAFSADTPPALLALEAEVELAGPEGARTIPLGELYGPDGRWSVGETPGGAKPGELLVRVRLKLPEEGWQGAYEKIRVRESIDFPLAGVAMMVKWAGAESHEIAGLRVALTAVNPRPEPLGGLDKLVGREMTTDLLAELCALANRKGKPMRTTVSDPAYRRAMVGALIEKTAARLAPWLAAPLAEKARWD